MESFGETTAGGDHSHHEPHIGLDYSNAPSNLMVPIALAVQGKQKQVTALHSLWQG